MPGDALAAAIEQARTSFSQRQKTVNALAATLKSTTSVLGKANKSLTDYAELHAGAPSRALDQAQQVFAGLRLKDDVVDPLTPDLRREIAALGKVVGALKDAQVAVRGDVVDVVRLGRATTVLRAQQGRDQQLTALLADLEHELQQAQQALGNTFGAALRDATAALGIEIEGRPPRFGLGRFEIEANWIARSAKLSYGKELLTGHVPLSIDAVLGAYQREKKAIVSRNEDGERWIEQFYQAWEVARFKRDRGDGRANLVDCYFELAMLRQSKAFRMAPSKRTITDYTRAQFVYDVFEFVDQRRLAYKGLRAVIHGSTKSQTGIPDRSIWIVEGTSPDAGRYVSDVEFRESA
ncbi:MAG: hypothetical protein NVSMB42_20760 [Herpetosiphon sp.]